MPNNSKEKISAKEEKPSRRTLKAEVVEKRSKSPVHLRRLTVSSQAVPRFDSNNGLKSIPFLRLTGVWLDEAGFPVDSKVDVIVDDNLLIIKPALL